MDREKYLLLKDIDKELLQELILTGAFVAGGAITSVFSGAAIKDYDIYFGSAGNCSALMQWLRQQMCADSSKATHAVSTDCAETWKRFGNTYQLIKMPEMMGEPRDVITKFDFTICQGAYRFNDESFVCSPTFMRHLAQRRLVFNVSAGYPICSLFRTRKFTARGYKLSGVEALKIGLSIEKLNMKSFADLRKQMMGIDTLFMKELTEALKKPEQAEQQYDFDKAIQLIEEHMAMKYKEDEEEL
jgi:hypothetical protein